MERWVVVEGRSRWREALGGAKVELEVEWSDGWREALGGVKVELEVEGEVVSRGRGGERRRTLRSRTSNEAKMDEAEEDEEEAKARRVEREAGRRLRRAGDESGEEKEGSRASEGPSPRGVGEHSTLSNTDAMSQCFSHS